MMRALCHNPFSIQVYYYRLYSLVLPPVLLLRHNPFSIQVYYYGDHINFYVTVDNGVTIPFQFRSIITSVIGLILLTITKGVTIPFQFRSIITFRHFCPFHEQREGSQSLFNSGLLLLDAINKEKREKQESQSLFNSGLLLRLPPKILHRRLRPSHNPFSIQVYYYVLVNDACIVHCIRSQSLFNSGLLLQSLFGCHVQPRLTGHNPFSIQVYYYLRGCIPHKGIAVPCHNPFSIQVYYYPL